MSEHNANSIGRAVSHALERQGLVSHVEAAGYLDVSPATLHAWNHKGSGPRSFRVGKHRKYRLSDLDLWLEGRASDQARPA